MIISFSYPSPRRFGGGLSALYEYANGMARRGHGVHFIHGPAIPDRIDRVEDIAWFRFEPSIEHHVVDTLDDPSLPSADVIFLTNAPERLGLPAALIQGHRLLSAAIERPMFRARCPKFCVARWLTDVGVAWGSPPEQMLHVPLGFDLERFRRRAPADPRTIDVAMLYTNHPVKGGADGLAALREVRRSRPDLRVVLFGLDEPRDPAPDWAEFRPGPDHDQLATEVFGDARIYLQPSWHEGFGLTAVEAMASGSTLVTTDNGGSRDYAFDGRTAVVVPPREPRTMASALERLLDDDRLRIRLGEQGRDAVARFDWDVAARILEQNLEIYLADPGALQKPPGDAPLFLEDDR